MMTQTYAFLLYGPDVDFGSNDQAEIDSDMAKHEEFSRAVEELGARIVGGQVLAGPAEGGRVTRDNDRAVHTDGPFPELTEVIGGYYEIEVDDAVMARKVAEMIPEPTVEWRRVYTE